MKAKQIRARISLVGRVVPVLFDHKLILESQAEAQCMCGKSFPTLTTCIEHINQEGGGNSGTEIAKEDPEPSENGLGRASFIYHISKTQLRDPVISGFHSRDGGGVKTAMRYFCPKELCSAHYRGVASKLALARHIRRHRDKSAREPSIFRRPV